MNQAAHHTPPMKAKNMPDSTACSWTPSNGDSVRFVVNDCSFKGAILSGQHLHGIVTHANGPNLVNLLVVDHVGSTHAMLDVDVRSPDAEPAPGMYCEPILVELGALVEGGGLVSSPGGCQHD